MIYYNYHYNLLFYYLCQSLFSNYNIKIMSDVVVMLFEFLPSLARVRKNISEWLQPKRFTRAFYAAKHTEI